MQFGKRISWEKRENKICIRFEKGDGEIRILSDKIIQVFSNLEGKILPSKAVKGDKTIASTWTVAEKDDALIIKTKELTVKVYDDFFVDFYLLNGRVLCRDYRGERTPLYRTSETRVDLLIAEGHEVLAEEKPDAFSVAKIIEGDEAFYGLGDKTGPLDKRGYEYDMWNTDEPKTHVDFYKALYKSVPFSIVLRKDAVFGLFFDNACYTRFDLGKESENYYYYAAKGGNLNYYFIYGEEMPDVIKGYTYLTGTSPLPQKWTLGYHQSRWGYLSTEDIEYVAENMRKHGVPCDAIHLDIDYMNEYRVFTFHPERFKDLKETSAKLAKVGFKLISIIDPGVKAEDGYFVYEEGKANDYFAKTPAGKIYENAVWPGDSVYPDFGKTEVREWWADKHKILTDAGLRGVWNDMNEPSSFKGAIPDDTVFTEEDIRSDHAHVHNVYGHYECQATYDGLKKHDGRRPFVLTRAAYAGTQKYAFAWTGDNQSIWAHLQMAIPQLCNLGLSGMALSGTDIGGFTGDTTKELLIRWVQLAVFTPFMRNHSQWGTRMQEPWQFDGETLLIYRKAVKLRYKLLPYIYDLCYETEKTGMPIMRPLVLHYEKDESVRNLNGEFLLGEALLVAPVIEAGARMKAVYLPEGEWYDYYTGERYEGKRWILREAPLDICPLYVKAGTVIPVWEEQSYVGEKDTDTVLRLEAFSGDASWVHIQDNGEDFDYRLGKYNLYQIEQKNRKLSISLIHKGYEKQYQRVIVIHQGKEYAAELSPDCTINLEI